MTNPQTKLMAALDPIARRLGYYTAYELDGREYVGTVYEQDLVWVREWLLMNGYERSPTIAGVNLEAAKKHPDKSGRIHDLSLRKVDPDDERKQYHVHLWELPGQTEVFSHHEYRPDVCILDTESMTEAKERLETHYRPEWGETYIRGKACEVVEGLV